MKVNLDIVQHLVSFPLPNTQEIIKKINAQLGGVEHVIHLGEKYAGARIVKVVNCEKHPDADRLHITKIDDGGKVNDVERDENGLVQVVCGAPNVHAHMWAVWLPPKTTVPASFDDEPFVLDARKLRGVISYGMLAAGDELALNHDHDGIIEITDADLPRGKTLEAGASFADVFGLGGTIVDIENKMFTHRPDCFGQLGVAREIAGIFGEKFTSPDWYKTAVHFPEADTLPLHTENNAAENVPRFMTVAIEAVDNRKSPLWLQCALAAMGASSINFAVDITNYMMLMSAQPAHAYDYDKLHGATIEARMARDGEKITLLNGKTYTLTPDDIVIADGERAIGLAGIMGGTDTEVSAETTRIVLEVATFDMYTLRKTAMRHGIFTDALTRFSKGQSPHQTDCALQEMMKMVGGTQASKVADTHHPASAAPRTLTVQPGFINARLGTDFSTEEMAALLENVEFGVNINNNDGGQLAITVPFWRMDIEQPEDIVEEIGRLHGFEHIPQKLPARSTKPVSKNPHRELANILRKLLSALGAHEVLSYSFVSEKLLKNAAQNSADAYQLDNALSPDLQCYRFNPLPSLLDKVHPNIKSGHDEFALFEIGKGHHKNGEKDADGVPVGERFLDIVYAAKKTPRGAGAPFYQMRQIVADALAGPITTAPVADEFAEQRYHPFDPTRSAWITVRGRTIGVVGELKPAVCAAFKLPAHTAAASLSLEALETLDNDSSHTYRPLSKYPSTRQDLSLKVAANINWQTIEKIVNDALQTLAAQKNLSLDYQLLTIYQPEDASTKTYTIRLTMTHPERTLQEDDARAATEYVAAAVEKEANAERA